MYVPRAFREDDRERLYDLIEANAFGILVATTDRGIEAAHIPFLLDRADGVLRGHVARANPIWRGFDGAQEALAIFQGPHAYISPDWYASTDLVPTWNYAVAHVYGAPRVLDDEAVERLLGDLSAAHEAGLAPKAPWSAAALSPKLRADMIKAIAGFALPIARLEGKFKLSQNRKPEEISSAAQALGQQADPFSQAVGALMAALPAARR